jgi:hypothetical protein
LVNKLWINDSSYMKVDSNTIYLEFFRDMRKYGTVPKNKISVFTEAYRYRLVGDTLKLDAREFGRDKVQNFFIKALSSDEVKFLPLNEQSNILSFPSFSNKIINFRERHMVYTDTVKLEKIVFNTTNCYGFCPAMTLQIDNNKQMKFIGGRHAIKEGLFTSTLSNSLYNELTNILKMSELDKLVTDGDTNIDLSTHTIEIHYNNKVKYISSCRVPYVAEDLLKYLLTIPQKTELVESKAGFEIKFVSN